jgi:2-polyprenyl-3-methyl-5-hydroxy-6-metoxy-1,4-benzoquinol methylase
MRARARDAAVGASTVRASTDPMVSAELSAARLAPADRIAAGLEPAFRRLVARAASRFRPAGRGPYYFARGKLGGDPVFAALLRDGRITSDARIVDIGCGLGILAALLAAAEQCDPRSASAWPQTWAPPPLGWTLRGFDLRMDAIATAQRALFDIRDRVLLSIGDVRAVTLSECDVVVILDVLHYIDRVAQRALLTNAHAALAPGGMLLLRVADAAPNWRFRFTSAVDWWVTFARQKSRPQLHWRPLAEWTALLEAIGFSVVAQPMSEGTLFANVLLIATKRSPPEQ